LESFTDGLYYKGDTRTHAQGTDHLLHSQGALWRWLRASVEQASEEGRRRRQAGVLRRLSLLARRASGERVVSDVLAVRRLVREVTRRGAPLRLGFGGTAAPTTIDTGNTAPQRVKPLIRTPTAYAVGLPSEGPSPGGRGKEEGLRLTGSPLLLRIRQGGTPPTTGGHPPLMLPPDREDASSMVTAGATANTTVKNGRASRESGLLCSHSRGESIAPHRPSPLSVAASVVAAHDVTWAAAAASLEDLARDPPQSRLEFGSPPFRSTTSDSSPGQGVQSPLDSLDKGASFASGEGHLLFVSERAGELPPLRPIGIPEGGFQPGGPQGASPRPTGIPEEVFLTGAPEGAFRARLPASPLALLLASAWRDGCEARTALRQVRYDYGCISMQRYWSSLRYFPRGVSVIPRAVSLRASISQSTGGILGIPLPALLSIMNDWDARRTTHTVSNDIETIWLCCLRLPGEMGARRALRCGRCAMSRP